MITTMPPVLIGHDCCDRCSAPAKVRALLRTGGELLFKTAVATGAACHRRRIDPTERCCY